MRNNVIHLSCTKPNNLRLESESGSVLASVLVVSVSLFILASTMLFFMVSRYSQHQQNQNRTTATYLAESALTRLESQTYSQTDLPADTFSAPNGGTYSVETHPWGAQLLVKATGTYANQTVDLWAIAGSTPSLLHNAAMVVADTRFPIVAAGDTRIVGDIHAGPLGLQPGQIRGEAPVKEDYHRGRVLVQQRIPHPPSGSECLKHYVTAMERRRDLPGSHLPGTVLLNRKGQNLLAQDTILHIENNLRLEGVELSLSKRVSVYVGGSVEIAGHSRITGPIEIVAQGPIYLTDHAVFDGGLLYSPDSVVLADQSTLLGSAVSNTAVFARDSARAFFPALLYAQGNDATRTDSVLIAISTNAVFEASITAATASLATDTIGAVIYVDTTTTVRGLLQCQDRVDLRGSLQGTVYTGQFRYFISPTTYINWLKDARIYRSQLNYYPALPAQSDEAKLTVARILTP